MMKLNYSRNSFSIFLPNFVVFDKMYYIIHLFSDTKGCKTTADGPQVSTPCIFPFSFKGTEYNECIFESGDDTPWCSTKVDENGKHVSGKNNWGYCEESCPISGKN